MTFLVVKIQSSWICLLLSLFIVALDQAAAFQLAGTRFSNKWDDNLGRCSAPTGCCEDAAVPSSSSFAKIVLLASTANSDASSAASSVDSLAASAKDAGAVVVEGAEEWTKARTHNKNWVRALVLLGSLAAAAAASVSSSSPQTSLLHNVLPSQAASTIHVLSFGTWFGTMVYTTFIAGLTMFQNMPRKMFGKVQSKLFPKYFALCSATLLLQLWTVSSLGGGGAGAGRAVKVLLLGLGLTLFNQLYLEPKSTTIMFERYRLDDVPGGPETAEYKSLKSQFGKLHGMSSLINLLALCTGVAHAVFLASGLAK